MKVAVGRLAEKVIVGLRASKVIEMNSVGGTDALADDDGLRLGDSLIDGESDREPLALGLKEAEGEMEAEIEPLGLIDGD